MSIDPDTIGSAAAYVDARNSGAPEVVAGCHDEGGSIVVNRAEPWQGRAKIAGIRTFASRDAGSGNALDVNGWDLSPDGKVKASHGWYDAEDCARQVAGG